jgi:hypothetical protein
VSIWDMSGADLAREIGQPAPVAVFQVPRVADIAAVFAGLSVADRAALLRLLKPETKRIGGGATFRGSEDFFPAFNAAREACRAAHGPEWYLNPSVALKARVPGAWVALRGEMGTYRSPRDVNFPRAEYWPGGALPAGPEYAEHGPIDRGDGHAWKMERAKRRGKPVPILALEHTPEEIAA